MMLYLEKKHNVLLVFVPSEPNIDFDQFVREDWSSTVYANERRESKKDIQLKIRNFFTFSLTHDECEIPYLLNAFSFCLIQGTIFPSCKRICLN